MSCFLCCKEISCDIHSILIDYTGQSKRAILLHPMCFWRLAGPQWTAKLYATDKKDQWPYKACIVCREMLDLTYTGDLTYHVRDAPLGKSIEFHEKCFESAAGNQIVKYIRG